MCKIIYYLLPALLMGIHVYGAMVDFLPSISLYLSIFATIGAILFYKNKVNGNLFVKRNLLFLFAHLLLILPYFSMTPTYFNVIFISIFILLEGIRLSFIQHEDANTRLIEQYEEERKNINETFRVVRSERHDFLKHVAVLQYMLEHENWLEAKNYLHELVEGYEETNLSIKGERGVVASILHKIYGKGKKEGIEMIYDIDIPISSLPLIDTDLVALISNLLTNSLEAAVEWQKVTGQHASVTVQFYKRSGLYILVCENDCLPLPNNIADELFSTYGHTTKGDGHQGLGTKIIADMVNKYHGFLDFTHRGEKFTIKIKIPALH